MGGEVKRLMPLHRHLCFLDVGHGNSTVIIAGEDGIVVVDTGRRHSILSEFFLEQGITHVRSIYLSHADADHVGGLLGILTTQEVSIGRVYLNRDASKKSKVWDDLVYELSLADNDGLLEFKIGLTSGHHEDLPGDVSVEVLGPSQYLVAKGVGSINRSGTIIYSNSISAVIAISVGSSTVALLPGDVDGVGLSDLFRNPQQDLSSKILVYPHHGGAPGAGTTPEEFAKKLLSEVRPDLVIFSIGRGKYSTPNPDMVGHLRQLLPQTRMICTQLSGHCADHLPAVQPTHLSETIAAAGREYRACCGGTVVVPLDNVSAVQPQKVPHIEFIQNHAPTSLCLEHLPLEQE
ncbi:MAG: MBL fold metallo-hydrolase [Rhodothermaceae bacterium]|nr:MBL fold metallo-hydrolase [Bacteroidota bacterium]MXW32763.1 MBL fold metallo-hydrolase [Rhodothermaceae bacterium]MYE61858.1 MBL fold metallo-hydrolase [Rhodothermaceae bacterium]MYJ21674.1 MBL fold metallo-hydrolase [Rhodothermaceae bacterium]